MTQNNLESIIGKIRDILRTEGITGMDSINHCIMFFLCRSLDADMCAKFDIPEEFTFENIQNDENGDELGESEFYEKFYNKRDVIHSFIGYVIFNLGFTNIKGHFKMKYIDNIKKILRYLLEFKNDKMSEQYDIIGTIYEVHLKSGASNSMRDLGQYFTSRKVIEYMIKLCDPVMIKGNIETIVDPTMGTGGFLTMAIKYLNKKYKNKIDWSKNKSRIYGFDIDDNVRNMALVNCVVETGEMMSETLLKEDTLRNDMKLGNSKKLEKAKIILANEPMGLKNLTHDECCDRIKNLGIEGTKAELLFLQLFMEALDKDGRCAVVIPDGVLFNGAKFHKYTRKHLVENFNLKKVVSLNGDFFLNTGVKTSVLFFSNDGKTKEVEFCQIGLKNEEIEETCIIKVSYDDVVEKEYNLFVNKYNVVESNKYKEVDYVSLRDICVINYGSSKTVEKGEYPMIGGGEKVSKFVDQYNVEKNTIIIARSGNPGYVTLTKDKSFVASYGFYLTIHMNHVIDNKYFYHYLKSVQNEIQNLGQGTCVKNLNRDMLYDMKIPIPSLEIQKEIVEQLDVLSENMKTLEKANDELTKIINYYIHVHAHNHKTEKIGDICEIMSGEYIKKSDVVAGKYPIYGGGSASGCIDRSNRSDDIVIAKDGVTLNCVRYVEGEFFLNHHGWTLKLTKSKIIKQYVRYYLLSIQPKIYSLAAGSAQKGINKMSFCEIVINIPPVEIQKQIVAHCDNITCIIKKNCEQIKENDNLMKKILDNCLQKYENNAEQKVKKIESDDECEEETPKNDIIKKSKTVEKSTIHVKKNSKKTVKVVKKTN